MRSGGLADIGAGVVAALLAAAAFPLVLTIGADWRGGVASVVVDALVLVGYGVALTSWFVVPLGALLGYFLLPVIRRARRVPFLIAGSAAGAMVGIVVTVAVTIVYRGIQFPGLAALLVPYCVAAVLAIGACIRLRASR